MRKAEIQETPQEGGNLGGLLAQEVEKAVQIRSNILPNRMPIRIQKRLPTAELRAKRQRPMGAVP